MPKNRWIDFSIIIVSILLAVLFSMSQAGQMIDLKLYDIFSMVKPRPPEWNKILYVDIDNQSIDLIGKWPIPRDKIAEGIAVLKEFGADKILLDIEYNNPAPLVLNQEYYDQSKESKSSLPVRQILDNLVIDPDKALARAFGISPTNVYLTCRGVDETKKIRTDIAADSFMELQIVEKFFIPIKDKSLTNRLVSDLYMESPVYPLYTVAKGLGFTTSEKDIDGSLRKIKLFRIYKDKLVPQLSLPVILDEFNVDRDKIEIKPGEYIKLITKDNKIIKIPVSQKGEMYINWTKKWSETPFGQHIPFVALIDYYNMKQEILPQIPYLNSKDITEEERQNIKSNIKTLEDLSNKLALIKGKITITGWTADSSTDIGMITIDPQAPLALLQGNLINTIYQKAFLTELPFFWNVIISFLFILGIFIVSIRITSAFKEAIASLFILIGLFLIQYLFLAVFGIILNYVMILLSTIISLAAFISYKFVQYDRQKNYIKKAFMQYLSPEVVQEVIENPSLLKLGGERREITAYFSDVAGFTSISEKLTPEEVVALLNKYLTAMTDIILANGGTVDKYEGDAIVAFFGAPIPHPDHAIRCCSAAVDMQNALVNLREEWIKEGYPPVIARMGINTGPAIIGNMGSEQRMDYTMMGDTVNSASRFEGANKAYGTFTMISEFTYNQVKDKFVVRKLDLLRVVGKTTPTEVYELVGRIGEVSPEKLSIIDEYHSALQEYRAKKWDSAYDMFRDLVKKYNDPPSRTYFERCQKYKKTPPPEDWDGVFILSTK